MTPLRLQRRRTKGHRLPEGAVYVGRPSKWGNPFRPMKGAYLGTSVCVDVDTRLAVELYRGWLLARIRTKALDVNELRGKSLACWCPLPKPGEPDYCHAAILLKVANSEAT